MNLFSWRKKSQGSKNHGGLAVSDSVKDARLSAEFLLNAIEDGVVMVGNNNVIHLFNPAASKISGWAAPDAVGLDFHSVIALADDHGNPFATDDHPFAKALKTNTTVRDSRSLLTTKNGSLIPISLIVSPVTDKSAQAPDGVVGVFRDITTERVEENRRTEFTSTASHEMRTPIAAIEGYLSLTLNPKVSTIDDRARKYLEKAHAATEHLSQLFQDLLTSSKAEDGRIASYPKVVELGEIVEQAADAAGFGAHKKSLELKYVVSSNKEIAGGKVIRPLFYVHLDPDRIREVLQNLIDNAIKYTPQGSITVALTGDDHVVQIQVQDTGPGIPQEDIGHLFQKFYRVDNSMTRSVGGTGLGLFICKKIVELYNGHIWVESEVGKGSTFFINLPRLTGAQALEIQKKEVSSISPLRENLK